MGDQHRLVRGEKTRGRFTLESPHCRGNLRPLQGLALHWQMRYVPRHRLRRSLLGVFSSEAMDHHVAVD